MDHQWAGHTQGKKGGIHSGESVALHTAAVLADAWQIGRELYGDTARLTVVGESLGGGPGALGALVAHQAGLLTLEGAAFPPGPIAAVLQAPFLGAKKNFINSALAAAAQLPLLNRIPMWGLGLPDFVDDKRGEHRVAQQMVLGDIRGQLQAFKASDRFLARVQGLLAAGTGPGGPVHIIHDDKDPLADYAGSVELKRLLGDGARLTTLSRGNHGLSASDADLCAEVIMAMLKRP
jgi:pimeloyl-ACP methyl ester carboxylesterase